MKLNEFYKESVESDQMEGFLPNDGVKTVSVYVLKLNVKKVTTLGGFKMWKVCCIARHGQGHNY